MPPVTIDAQCLSIGERRRWLVAGVIDYSRVPRGQWAERIRAARQIGLNCVVAPVVWSQHERAPGKIEFEDDLDIAEFVRLVGSFGMLCILRPGPFIGAGHDKGGIPAWLEETPDLTLRSASPGFLEAAARFLTAVVGQVKTLQATNSKPGPIVLVQNEHRWFCGDAAGGDAYLGETGRYLRESGMNVPMLNTNNLFHGLESEIDGWNGYDGLFAILRQLRAIRPDHPLFVADFEVAQPTVWGMAEQTAHTPDQVLHRLAQAFAAGANVSIGPFHGGTSFGFEAGRLPFVRDGYITTSYDCGAPLSEAGVRTPLYDRLKRLCTFVSSFERVFVALDPAARPATINPAIGATAVIHTEGQQGSIVWAFRNDSAKVKGRASVDITLPDGAPMTVDLTGQPVAWCLFDALLHERATLDWCSFNAFTRLGKVFVCFAPAGATGALSINGSELPLEAPSAKTPTIIEHEGVTLVVCNEDQIDAAYVTDDSVFIGVAGIDEAGEPVAHPGFKQCARIGADGEHSTVRTGTPQRKPNRPTLSDWQFADQTEYISGSSDRFATIDGPATLDALGAPHGYGWIRLEITSGNSRTVKSGVFEFADRLHMTINDKPGPLIGQGPGAESTTECAIKLRKGRNVITILVDNLGRAAGGVYNGERKGLWGHIHQVAPLKAGKCQIMPGDPIAPVKIRSPLTRLHADDRTRADRPTWEFTHRKKTPLAVTIDTRALGGASGVLVVNDAPAHIFGEGGWDRVMLDEEPFRRGKNVVQLALIDDVPDLLKRASEAVTFYDCDGCVSDTATWAFAKWEAPRDETFKAASKTTATSASGAPAWWRSTFKITNLGAPLFFDASGLSKGQIFLNGRNLGRYWVAEADRRKKVNGQSLYYLPEAWLREGEDNEIMLFDEHGADPTKTLVVYA